MQERFKAFTFVDRITELEPGRRARGRFEVPAGLERFPGTLVAEAVGQLAAWVAMAHVGFRGRPVAALARESHYLGAVAPGDVIDLAVDVERCDDESVVYRGWADVGGRRVRALDDCLGPMLPLSDFDAPEAVRDHFELLCAGGAAPGAFGGVPEPDLETLEREPGRAIRARLRVPREAAFFADHFPRRPVYPATMLLDALVGLALDLGADTARERGGDTPALASVADVKVRSFITPGETVELAARAGGDGERISLAARVDGKRAATATAVFRGGSDA